MGDAPVRPEKFAHVVIRTNRFRETVEWYRKVLHAWPAFENDFVAFITYDDEHHRLAFVNTPDAPDPGPESAGVDHFAYTYATLGDLVHTYERLKAEGITPAWTINHGPTTSLYYEDPNGIRVELQIDNFESVEDLHAWFRTPAFARNPIGVEFDADVLAARYREGLTREDLQDREVLTA